MKKKYLVSEVVNLTLKEIMKSKKYDFFVLNDNFDKAFEDLSKILFENVLPENFSSRVPKDLIKRLVE